jgi:hypothetical protein
MIRRTSVIVRGDSMTQGSIDCEIVTLYARILSELTMEVSKGRFMGMTIYMMIPWYARYAWGARYHSIHSMESIGLGAAAKASHLIFLIGLVNRKPDLRLHLRP